MRHPIKRCDIRLETSKAGPQGPDLARSHRHWIKGSGGRSEPVVAQVAVDVLEAVVPVEDQVAPLERPQAGDAELDYILEVPTMLK